MLESLQIGLYMSCRQKKWPKVPVVHMVNACVAIE